MIFIEENAILIYTIGFIFTAIICARLMMRSDSSFESGDYIPVGLISFLLAVMWPVVIGGIAISIIAKYIIKIEDQIKRGNLEKSK